MLKEERQQGILNELYKGGSAPVNDLCGLYGVSKATIRRDLEELEEQGFLRRVYGGAVPARTPAAAVDVRQGKQRNEKYLVARKALEMIKTESLIAIDGGSTNVMLASLLPLNLNLRVVTNSFPVAAELRKRPRVEVVFLGGQYDKGSQTTVGEVTLRQAADFRFDQLFLGVFGVDPEFGVTAPYPYDKEVEVKRELIMRSAQVIAMATVAKLGQHSNYAVCPLDAVSRIICENPVSAALNRRYGGKIV